VPQIWEVRIKNQAGTVQAILTGQRDGFTGFSFTQRVNSPGAYLLYFMKRATQTDADFLTRVGKTAGWFELDGQVEFWRRWPEMGIDKQLVGTFLQLDWEWYITVEDGLMFYSSGRGPVDLLGRPIIDAAAGTTTADKAGPAESVIKEYITEQKARGATSLANVAIEADGAGGNVDTWKRGHRNLLEIVQEIAKAGGGDFDVIPTTPANWEFQWHDGQLGTDRSIGSDRVRFAYDLGNMRQPRLKLAHHDEINAVLVGGQESGTARERVWRTDAARMISSPWNRREVWRDQRQEDETAGLETAGDETLAEGNPTEDLTFIPVQIPSALLGYHYRRGDLVLAEFMGHTAVKKVVETTFTFNRDVQEINVELEDA